MSSSATNRPTLISKVPLRQQRQNLPKPQVQHPGQTVADRRGEGLNNGHCRTNSTMTLKALLDNTLKCAEICQTLLVGENEKNNPEEGEYPKARESCTADKKMNHRDHLLFLQLFVAQLSNCRQNSLYFQPLQHIPISEPLISPSNYPSSMFVRFGKFVPMCWRNTC